MLRTLLIWLLVLALPAQGAMAASMAWCGPNHHASASSATALLVDQTAHEHHEHAPHDAAHAVEGQAGEAVSGGSATPQPLAQGDMQKCSVCASCCSAAVIHSAEANLPGAEPGATVFATLVPAVEPFAADGPDRPPRRRCA
jgi:hypothetical protein